MTGEFAAVVGAPAAGGPAGVGRLRPAPSLRHGAPRWHPLTGDGLLERLRVTGRRRPGVDPELADRLRARLDQGIVAARAELAETTGDCGVDAPGSGPRRSGPALVVTKEGLNRKLACDAHRIATGSGGGTPTTAMACGAMIDVLFRQLVTVGASDDPMADGMAALSVDERQRGLSDWIERLPAVDRAELRSEVERQAEGLRRRWPSLEPGWLPRTQEAMRAPLAGGAVELSARVDLAIGRPAVDEASVAIVEVKSGSRRAHHSADLHFYALIETLRSSAPPFVVATYYTRSGELDVEPITEEVLAASARRTLAGTRALVGLGLGSRTAPDAEQPLQPVHGHFGHKPRPVVAHRTRRSGLRGSGPSMTTAAQRTLDVSAPAGGRVDASDLLRIRDRLIAALPPVVERLPPGEQLVMTLPLLRTGRRRSGPAGPTRGAVRLETGIRPSLPGSRRRRRLCLRAVPHPGRGGGSGGGRGGGPVGADRLEDLPLGAVGGRLGPGGQGGGVGRNPDLGHDAVVVVGLEGVRRAAADRRGRRPVDLPGHADHASQGPGRATGPARRRPHWSDTATPGGTGLGPGVGVVGLSRSRLGRRAGLSGPGGRVACSDPARSGPGGGPVA